MNPHGGSGGEADANNQNYLRPRFSSGTQERLIPLFPLFATEEDIDQLEVNFPQEDANDIGATTDVPLQETPNVVAPESNINSSSSFAGTSQNPEENRQGATISPDMVPSSNVALSAQGSDSSSVNTSRKRSLPENASPNVEEPKRFDTRSEVRATGNVIPHSAGTTTPPTNMRADLMDNTNPTRGSHAQPFIPTHSLQSSFQPSLSVQPLPFHSTSFMSGPVFSVNTVTVRNAPHSISSGFPHAGVDILTPFYQHEHNMFGPVVTSMGNFPTYRPNRSYFGTARRALSFAFPHRSQPPRLERLQFLPGIVGNGNTYHPLSGHASSSSWVPPQGSRGMNHSAAVSGPVPQNHQSLVQTSSSAIPPNVVHEPAFPLPQFPSEESRRRLPNEVQTILNSLGHGHALRFEELMILDYSLVLRAFEAVTLGTFTLPPQIYQANIVSLIISETPIPSRLIEHPELFGTSRSRGLSLETITQYMKRETFLTVDGEDDSEQNKEKCPICLEEFCNGEDIGKLHSCAHKFHYDCIKTWLNQKNRCPVCRRTGLETSNEQNVGGKAADAAVVHNEGDNE